MCVSPSLSELFRLCAAPVAFDRCVRVVSCGKDVLSPVSAGTVDLAPDANAVLDASDGDIALAAASGLSGLSPRISFADASDAGGRGAGSAAMAQHDGSAHARSNGCSSQRA